MPDHERSMLTFLELATISHRKRQLIGRNKLLVLTGIEACMGGWLNVAEMCREFVLRDSTSHILHRWNSLPDALRDESFQTFVKRLRLFCSYEKAEHLLANLAIDLPSPINTTDADAGQIAVQKLAEMR